MTITQSFLPVFIEETQQVFAHLPPVPPSGVIPGLLAIPVTEFVGDETTFALSTGSVSIVKKTLPVTNLRQRQKEYMAAIFTHTEQKNRAYAQFAEWIPLEDIAPAFSWQQNAQVNKINITEGVLLVALRRGFTTQIGVAVSPPPAVGDPSATMNLTVNSPIAGVDGAVFFDVNWVEIFQAQFPNKFPSSIAVTGQPAEDDLKAFILRGNQPVVGQITQNTIRIIKTKKGTLTPGDRIFTFRIKDQAQATPMLPPTLEQFATGGSLGAATYEYRVSAVVDGIESIASSAVSIVVAAGTTNRVVVTWGLVPGATEYHVYGRTTMKRLQTFGPTISSYDDTGADTPGTEDPILTNFTDVTLTVTIS